MRLNCISIFGWTFVEPTEQVSNKNCIIPLGSVHIFKDLDISPFTQLSCVLQLFEEKKNIFLPDYSLFYFYKFSYISEKKQPILGASF